MQTNEWTDDGGVTDQRERGRAMLDRIAGRARQALADAKIDLDLFFLIPNSGDAVLTFGTTSDADDQLWGRVDEIVADIVCAAIGLDRVRCREVTCAATTDADKPVVPIPIPEPLPVLDIGIGQR